jgi:prepilin-type N-terminal cleavage/methylation domain-containing protein
MREATTMRKLVRSQDGFTLAELLVVTAVLGLILAAVFSLLQSGQQAYTMGSNRVEVQQNARVALELMTRELRAAQSITTLGGVGDITFTVCDPATMAACTPVSVQYQLSGTNLNRISGGTTTTIIGGVQNLNMTYCDVWNPASNSCTTAAANAAAVKVIRVQLTAKAEDAAATGSAGDRRMTVESTIRLRNVNNS